MKIVLSEFGGIAPRFPEPIIKPPYAVDAANCNIETGRLEAFAAPLNVMAAVPEAAINSASVSLFYYKPFDVEYILSFSKKTFCVQNPLPNDQYKRVYWLTDGVLKYGGYNDILAGSGPYPGLSGWLLGVPIPTVTPILERVPYDAAVVDPEETDGKVPSYRAVTYCYASQFGELGGMFAPADGSALATIKVYEGDKIKVSGLPTTPSGNYAMGAGACKYLFCTDSNGNWRQCMRLTLAATTAEFDPFDMDTAPVATNALYETPPDAMQGICMSPFGFMYGWKDRTLCVSDALQMHTWNSDNQKSVPHKIIGVVPSASGAIVLTEGGAYSVVGSDPANLSVGPIRGALACVSADSVVDMGGYAMYATAEGVQIATVSEASLVTEDVILRNQFPDYNPAAMKAFRHRDGYIIISPSLTAILRADAGSSKLMPLTFAVPVRAGFTHPLTGEFVYITTASRRLWAFEGEDDARISAHWFSPRVRAPRRTQCRWLMLDGEALNGVRVVVKADGVDITNGGFVPAGGTRAYLAVRPYRPALEFTFEITLTTGKINSFALADSKQEFTYD